MSEFPVNAPIERVILTFERLEEIKTRHFWRGTERAMGLEPTNISLEG